MNAGLEIAIISAGAAILGTLGGALTTYLGTKRVTLEQWRLSQIDKEITAREKLYGEFLGEASLLTISSIDKKTDRVADFARLFSLLSQIRLVATQAVIDAAKRASERALDAHSSDPKPDPDVDRGSGRMFGHSFSEACRVELDALRVKAFRKVD